MLFSSKGKQQNYRRRILRNYNQLFNFIPDQIATCDPLINITDDRRKD